MKDFCYKNTRRQISYFILFFLTLGSIYTIFFPNVLVAEMDFENILLPISWDHWMGTDSLGRELLPRVFYGAGVTLSLGVLSSFTSLIMGSIFAVLVTELRPSLRRVALRGLDLFLSIPQFIFMVLISVNVFILFEKYKTIIPVDRSWISYFSLWAGISFTHWATAARWIQGFIQEEWSKNYVNSAFSIGAGRFRIFHKHIYPNIKKRCFLLWLTLLPSCILYEGVMSFLGFGINPPQISLGILINDGWRSLSEYPHLLLFPSLILFLFVWSINGLINRK
ncbi:MAG TPA: ABC transporter permease [Pseudobdellovibrionaceae bacterium]|nr:ABC transporter permease [Pseudobdellovibrionaceae bacterium]